MFYYSCDRKANIPRCIWPDMPAFYQATAYDGYNKLYLAE
jgi:hypothetical protein